MNRPSLVSRSKFSVSDFTVVRNALLTEVLRCQLEPGSSFFRYQFLDPVARRRIVNWAERLRRGLARRTAEFTPADAYRPRTH